MKKFLIRLIFNKRQREIIWNAIVFSQHTYKRRGDIDNASEVGVVINETEKLFTEKEPKFTLSQVKAFVNKMQEEMLQASSDFAKSKFVEGVRIGKQSKEENSNGSKIEVHEISLEKCKTCEHNEECFIYKELMSEKEKSESDEKPSEDNEPKKEEETAVKDSEENDEKE